jgi:hypothetical protein
MKIWFRRFFILVSIGGSAAGLTATASQLFQAGHQWLFYPLYSVACAAHAFGMFSGLVFVENEERGLRLLSWYFLIQVPIFISPIVSYQFSSGITAYLTFGNNGLRWSAYFGGEWLVALFQLQEKTVLVGLNFFAVWATWYLRKALAKKHAELNAVAH